MNPRSIIASMLALAAAAALLLGPGCSRQDVTRPEQAEGDPADAASSAEAKTAPDVLAVAGPDVAVTNFTGQTVLYPGDTLTLSVTLANLGDANAVGPFDAWIGVLGTRLEAARRTVSLLPAGVSRSAVLEFTLPAKALAAAVPPGVYTIYCTHDFDDAYPENDHLLLSVTLRSITPATFLPAPAGVFTMGSPANEPGRESDEAQHQVTLTHGIHVQTTEVTNQQYVDMAQWAYDQGHVTATSAAVIDDLDGSTENLLTMGLPSGDIQFADGVFTCINPGHPVKYVTWYGAAAYCDWLSLQEGFPRAYDHATWLCNGGDPYAAAGYRLPTEAEWEYLCRAGTTTAFCSGPIVNLYCYPLDANLDAVGWYCGNAADIIHPAAQKLPNAWGLYDLHGGVWEWCQDWYGAYGGDVTDPVGPATGTARDLRGGSWAFASQDCRSGARYSFQPAVTVHNVGFRPVRTGD